MASRVIRQCGSGMPIITGLLTKMKLDASGENRYRRWPTHYARLLPIHLYNEATFGQMFGYLSICLEIEMELLRNGDDFISGRGLASEGLSEISDD
jgi:hypothetical protein